MIILKTCYPDYLTVGISCTCIYLLSIYLDYQLYLLFASAATMLMVNKDYHYSCSRLYTSETETTHIFLYKFATVGDLV